MGVDEEFQKIVAGLFGSDGFKGPGSRDSYDDLRQRATRSVVEDLFDAGYLSGEALVAARAYLPQAHAWWRWISRMLLVLGSILVLAGVVFFFAYNWRSLGHYPRFAIIEAGLIACIAGALFTDLDEVIGKVLLLAASVLTGVLLLVFGQTYHTGVDSASLYVLWAALIFGWVIIAEFDVLWVGWLALANLAIGLYWSQEFIPDEQGLVRLMIALALINAFALVLREYFVSALDLEWLSAGWLRIVILISVLAYLMVPAIMLIESFEKQANAYTYTAAAMLVAVWMAVYGYFRVHDYDLRSLTVGAFSICVIAVTIIFRVMAVLHVQSISMLLVSGLLVVGVFSIAVSWLRRVNTNMAGENHA